MKTKNIINRLLLLPLLAAALLTSCLTDDTLVSGGPSTGTGDEATVTFSLDMSGTSAPATRAGLSENDESSVETVDVLLFRKEGTGRLYWGRVIGVALDNTPGATKSFKAVIPVEDYDNFDITVVANGRAQVLAAGLVRGDAKQAALNKLVLDIDADNKWSGPIPAWGEAVNVTVNSTTNLSGTNAVKMFRMLSRIDVQLSKLAATGSESGTGNANFALSSVRLYNYSTRGTLVPDLASGWNAGDASNPPVATAPHQPTGAGGYGKMLYDANEPLVYTASDLHSSAASLMPSLFERAIYTPEAPAGSATTPNTNTCLVIGGSYKNGTESFYRIDFAVKNSATQTYDYLALLRNHQYVVNVTKISGDGFDTPEDAFYSLPVNIEANVLPWNQADLGNIIFDENYLHVHQGEYTLGRLAGTDILTVRTDVENWSAKVCDENGNPLPANNKWLKIDGSDSAGSTAVDTDVEFTLSVTENTSTRIDRIAWIFIEAERLVYKVKVTQERAPWAGSLAAPGVIGYIKGTNKLTINGSKEYLGTPVMTDPTDTNIGTATSLATGEPLEDATVYVAQFRWGSLVATATEFYSDGTIASSPALPFAPRDIVAAPKDYNNLGDADLALAAIKELAAGGPGGTNTGAGAWGIDANQTIPFRGETTGGQSLGWTLDAANGLGDPCEYYFGDGWKLPMGNPWFKDGGTPFGARVTSTGWITPNAGGNYLGSSPLYLNAGAALYFGINGSVGGDGEGHPVWSMFLPAINRYRTEADGLNTSEGSARYWSSTAYSSATGSTLYASSSSTSSRGAGSGFGQGLGVRCVKSTPATTLSVTPADHTFDWDAFDQSQSQVFTVAADGAWTTVLPSSAIANFEIKQYTANGTLVTTAGYDERYTFFGFGNGTIVVTPKSNNSTTTERTFAFTVEAIGATASAAAPKTVTVTQGIKLNGGVLAAPGVIGYIKGTNTLTLKGSKEYASKAEIAAYAQAEFGGLSDQTVYVAYFKFGSLVATSSDYATTAFDPKTNIVRWPTDWAADRTAMEGKIGTATGQTSWNEVPVSAALAPGATIETDLTNGLGDPCDYWFGDHDGNGATANATENWRLPTTNTTSGSYGWYSDGGYPFATTSSYNTGISWTNTTMTSKWADYFDATELAANNLPAVGAVGGKGGGVKDWSMFLPAAGYRTTSGSVLGQGMDGDYWSSTATSSADGYYLRFNGSVAYPAYGGEYPYGFAVRCVQPVVQEPAPVPGVRNIEGTADGVIGYIHRPGHPDHHKLTMNKDDGYDADGIVYVAYFKFGSLVATSSEDYGTFTYADIVARPTEWAGTVTDWDSVPVVTIAGAGQELMVNGNVSPTKGTGDPCAYYSAQLGSGWRLPTRAENQAFIGRTGAVYSDTGAQYGGLVYYNWSLTGTASATNPGIGIFPQSPGGSVSLPAAGYRQVDGSVTLQGLNGHYWSSTTGSGSDGCNLGISSSNVHPGYYCSPVLGLAVRCVR